jgi:hypothetical protein
MVKLHHPDLRGWPILWLRSTLLVVGHNLGAMAEIETKKTGDAYGDTTLWLCQNSYWKWPFIVDLPIENGDFP